MSNTVDFEINKELGECYLFMGDCNKAREYYEKAVAADETKADPYMGFAAIALTEGDLHAAYAHYGKANKLEQSGKTLAGLGMVAMEMGKHEEAFTCYEKALQCDPVNMVAVNGLVQLGYFLNKLERVVPHLAAAVEADGSLEAVRYTLAGCLATLGQSDEAKVELEEILGTNPAHEQAKDLYAQFVA